MHRIRIIDGNKSKMVTGWKIMALLQAYWANGINARLVDHKTIRLDSGLKPVEYPRPEGH